jgi:hypothetical protein
MIGGYNHPVGENITHDPEYDVDILTVNTQAFGEPVDLLGERGPLKLLLRLAPILGGVILIAVAGTMIVARRKAKKATMIPKNAEFPALGHLSERGTDWSRYENNGDS